MWCINSETIACLESVLPLTFSGNMSKLILLFLFAVVAGSLAANVTSDERVFNGSEARPGQFPYQVSLRRSDGTRSIHFCGGAIISRRWVLSAASCVHLISNPVRDIQVVVGAHRRSGDGVPHKLRYVVRHINFNAHLRTVDLAMLKTMDFMHFTSTVRLIDTGRFDEPPNADGVPFTLSGWGNHRVSFKLTNGIQSPTGFFLI